MNVVGRIPTRNRSAEREGIRLAVDKTDTVVIGFAFAAGGIVPIGPPSLGFVGGIGVNRQFLAGLGFFGDLSTYNSDFGDPKEVFGRVGERESYVVCSYAFVGSRKINVFRISGVVAGGSLGTYGSEVHTVGGNREFQIGTVNARAQLAGTHVCAELVNVKGTVQGNSDISFANRLGKRKADPSAIFVSGACDVRIAYDNVVGKFFSAVGIGRAGLQ